MGLLLILSSGFSYDLQFKNKFFSTTLSIFCANSKYQIVVVWITCGARYCAIGSFIIARHNYNLNFYTMKTKFLLLIALLSFVSYSASAQFYNRKKVAITEVVDKSGDVAEGTKTYVRSALTDAITNSDGYEGYTSISFVSLEMNFDKTGNLSSTTLSYVKKQMMEYILVSEITPLDKQTVLLTARIVNASDGKIVASSSVRTYADIDYLDSACNSLCCKLVGAI